MDDQKKCFTEEHKDTKAISFCYECRIYMCNKCENYHNPFFKNHRTYKLNKEDGIFNTYCKEENHPNKLEFFCKDHNQLCCGLCICKLNEKGYGAHKDCDVCNIEKIKVEKMNKLKENIKCLEELEDKFNENIKKLKDIFEQIEKDKYDLKIKIQNIFTKIRNVINEREEKLIKEIDNLYNSNYFNEDIIKKGEKLPKQIKLSLEKGKLIDKEWDNDNLCTYINDCINIENGIKNINIINENINKFKTYNKMKINFSPQGNALNNFLNSLNSFGYVYLNIFSFKDCPKDVKDIRAYSLSGKNKNIITKTGKDGRMGTICEKELDKSKEEHKWKIRILHSSGKSIMVGVAPIDFDIHTSTYNTCGWYLHCADSVLYSGPPHRCNGTNKNLSKVDDEVIVIMNMKKRTLKFLINNEDKGDAYINIPIDKPLFPAVLLYHSNDSVEILE